MGNSSPTRLGGYTSRAGHPIWGGNLGWEESRGQEDRVMTVPRMPYISLFVMSGSQFFNCLIYVRNVTEVDLGIFIKSFDRV